VRVTFVDDHEVRLTIFVHFSDAAQKEPDAGVLQFKQKRHDHGATPFVNLPTANHSFKNKQT
jgi:hypothetical protein